MNVLEKAPTPPHAGPSPVFDPGSGGSLEHNALTHPELPQLEGPSQAELDEFQRGVLLAREDILNNPEARSVFRDFVAETDRRAKEGLPREDMLNVVTSLRDIMLGTEDQPSRSDRANNVSVRRLAHIVDGARDDPQGVLDEIAAREKQEAEAAKTTEAATPAPQPASTSKSPERPQASQSEANQPKSLSETLKELGVHDDDQLSVLKRVINTLPDELVKTDEEGNRRLLLNPDGTVPESLKEVLSEENIKLLTERASEALEEKPDQPKRQQSAADAQAAAQAQAAQAGGTEAINAATSNPAQDAKPNPNVYSVDKHQLQDFNTLAEPIREALEPFITDRLKDNNEKRSRPYRDLFYLDNEGRVSAYQDSRIENPKVLKELKTQLSLERLKANIKNFFGLTSRPTYGRRASGSRLPRANRKQPTR